MNLAEIFTKIEAGNQNPTFTREGFTLSLVNEALRIVSERFCIAALETTSTMQVSPSITDQAALPENYGHDIYRIENVTDNSREVNIRTNRQALETLFPGEPSPGYITDVAIGENYLFFKPAQHADSEDQELKLFYYSSVPDYEIGDLEEEPTWIPADLQRGLIVDYVLMELWGLEEDGIDGQKINTAFYTNRHNKALQDMARHTRFNSRQRPVIKRSASFF